MDHSQHDMHAGHDMHSGHDMSDHNIHDHVGVATTIAQDITEKIGEAVSHITHSNSEHSGHHGMMSMTFHGGCDETVLFDWWKFNSVGGLIASIIGIFVLAVLYEGLKYYREHLFWRTYNALHYQAVQPPELKASTPDEPRVVQPSMCSKFHAWQTALHAIQVTVSYFLMLIFMTYNSWLCLAVVAGAAFGNFLFGWKKSVVVDVTEHCH